MFLARSSLPTVHNGQPEAFSLEMSPVPTPARVISTAVSLLAFGLIMACLARWTRDLSEWRNIPIARWLILIVYIDSALFIFTTTIFRDALYVNTSQGNCTQATNMCLIFYLTSKLFVYLYFIEKCYIIRSNGASRVRDKLFLFNVFGLLVPYGILFVLAFLYRIKYIDRGNTCIIGVGRKAMTPILIIDIIMNIWLTGLFVQPLLASSNQISSRGSHVLRKVVKRTLKGFIVALLACLGNIISLYVTQGEEAWICLLVCNLEVLVAVLILQWVTSTDKSIPRDYQISRRNSLHFQLHEPPAAGIDAVVLKYDGVTVPGLSGNSKK